MREGLSEVKRKSLIFIIFIDMRDNNLLYQNNHTRVFNYVCLCMHIYVSMPMCK